MDRKQKGKVCIMPKCTSHINAKNDVSLHRFPKDVDLRKEWIDAITTPEWIPNIHVNSSICSVHFNVGVTKKLWRTTLSRDAIPKSNYLEPSKCNMLTKMCDVENNDITDVTESDITGMCDNVLTIDPLETEVTTSKQPLNQLNADDDIDIKFEIVATNYPLPLKYNSENLYNNELLLSKKAEETREQYSTQIINEIETSTEKNIEMLDSSPENKELFEPLIKIYNDSELQKNRTQKVFKVKTKLKKGCRKRKH